MFITWQQTFKCTAVQPAAAKIHLFHYSNLVLGSEQQWRTQLSPKHARMGTRCAKRTVKSHRHRFMEIYLWGNYDMTEEQRHESCQKIWWFSMKVLLGHSRNVRNSGGITLTSNFSIKNPIKWEVFSSAVTLSPYIYHFMWTNGSEGRCSWLQLTENRRSIKKKFWYPLEDLSVM